MPNPSSNLSPTTVSTFAGALDPAFADAVSHPLKLLCGQGQRMRTLILGILLGGWPFSQATAQEELNVAAAAVLGPVGSCFSYYLEEGSLPAAGLVAGAERDGRRVWDFTAGATTLVEVQKTLPAALVEAYASFPATTLTQEFVVSDGRPNIVTFYTEDAEGLKSHGFENPSSATEPLVVFDEPLLEYPASVTPGVSWSGTAISHSETSGLTVTSTRTVLSLADAAGLAILSLLGEREVVRISQVATHEVIISFQGMVLQSATYHIPTVKWLAPESGLVTEIVGTVVEGGVAPALGTLEVASSIRRLFAHGRLPEPRTTGISLEDVEISLQWAIDPTELPVRFLVQQNDGLAETGWRTVGQTRQSSTRLPLGKDQPQAFFRVLVR